MEKNQIQISYSQIFWKFKPLLELTHILNQFESQSDEEFDLKYKQNLSMKQ